MASPGVRAYQLAGALGRALPAAEITLGIPGLSQRIGSYIGRRAVFNFHDRKRERRQRQQMIARRAARAAKAGEGG